jgi:hypothetical protein
MNSFVFAPKVASNHDGGSDDNIEVMPGSVASGAGASVSSSDIDDLTKRIKDLEN